MAQHILVITGNYAIDPDSEIERSYEIECPGITDACRMWVVCDCPESAGGMEAPLWDDEVAHGVDHRYIEGDWMKPTDVCFVSTFDQLPEAAEDLALREKLGAGRHPIDFDYQGEGSYELTLAEAAR